MRRHYSATTCVLNDFKDEGFKLHQVHYDPPGNMELPLQGAGRARLRKARSSQRSPLESSRHRPHGA